MNNSTRKDDSLNGRTAVIILLVLFLFVLISLLADSTPAAAQAVTPLPGPQATATAAAQRLSDTQAQTAAADASFNQAVANKQQTDDAYRKAQIEFANAQANLQAQQYQQAGEAIGRGNAYIETGQAQANQMFEVVTQQKSIIEAQRTQIISASNELTQLRAENQRLSADKQTILQNFDALQTRLNDQQTSSTISPTIAVIAGLTGIFGLIGFVAWKWSRRGNGALPQPLPVTPAEPTIEGDFTVRDEDRAEDEETR